MKQYGFRHKILLLAVALVVATQLITLFPVLSLIKRDSEAQAERTVGLAGVLFDEYMQNRTEGLLTTANVLVSDFAFRQAVANGDDEATIRSVLRNGASRIGASTASRHQYRRRALPYRDGAAASARPARVGDARLSDR